MSLIFIHKTSCTEYVVAFILFLNHNLLLQDLKPENILISSTLVAKIADFGHACLYDEKDLSRNYEIDVS